MSWNYLFVHLRNLIIFLNGNLLAYTMKLLFIPNWNGHLHIQEYDDKSVSRLYELTEHQNKELIPVFKNDIHKTNFVIENAFDKYRNEFILSITGDHSNSYPLIKAFSKENKNYKLVVFDAHPDCEVSTEIVSHEDYLRNLIEDRIVNPQDIYLFGIRTFSRIEFEYLKEKKVNFYTISDILRDTGKIEEILRGIREEIYLSIDVDVLDPDDAPATYYSEWCGLRINELIEFVKIILPNVKSADISEFYIEKDKDEITQRNVLKLIETFLKK